MNSQLVAKYNAPVDETVIYNPLALVAKAKGSLVWVEGQKEPYFDLLMSYSSTNFGHVNKDILKFVKEAIKKYDNIIGFNSSHKVTLSKKLVELLPYPGNKITYYPVGGTKAIDAAIKLAKAYTKKDTVISFEGAFHGYSYTAMSVTDDRYIEKTQYGSYPGIIKRFPFPHRLEKNADKVAEKILDNIREYLNKKNKEVAAIIFEPIQGAAGFIIPPKGFLENLINIARKNNVVTICDEIQTGIYRTGTFYYINQLKLNPDIVLLSKSLAGGYYPLSAVIANRELYESVDTKHSGFDSTFATNLFGIEVADKLLDYAKENKISERVKETGKYLKKELENLFKQFPFIKDFDSVGMAYGYRVESSINNPEESALLAKKIRKIAFKNHLITQTAGIKGDHMKLAPNFFITKDEIAKILLRLKKTLEECN